jgi:hypothetical protein
MTAKRTNEVISRLRTVFVWKGRRRFLLRQSTENILASIAKESNAETTFTYAVFARKVDEMLRFETKRTGIARYA